jgi:hypothetical protein
MKFNARIRSLPRKPYQIDNVRSLSQIGLTVVDHTSELIQTIGGTNNHYLSHHRPDEVFIDLFLSELPESKDLDFGLRLKVSDSISRRRAQRRRIHKDKEK